MKNCLSCKISDECGFGKAVDTFLEYKENDDDDGISTVVHLLIENIEQYIDCSYYEE